MASHPFSLRLSATTRARLDEQAQRLARPVSQVAQRAIERYLDAQDELRRMIDAAVEEADAGVFVSSEAINAWIDTWGSAAEAPPPEPDVFPEER